MKSLRWWMVSGVAGSWIFTWGAYGENFAPPTPVATDASSVALPDTSAVEPSIVAAREEEPPPQVSVEYQDQAQPPADIEGEAPPSESAPIASATPSEREIPNRFGDAGEPGDPIEGGNPPDAFDVGGAPPPERGSDEEPGNWL